jgi:hypothetical protein
MHGKFTEKSSRIPVLRRNQRNFEMAAYIGLVFLKKCSQAVSWSSLVMVSVAGERLRREIAEHAQMAMFAIQAIFRCMMSMKHGHRWTQVV